MRLKYLSALPLIFFIFLLLPGCPNPGDDDDGPAIVSPRWDTYDGWRRFYTNDPDYYNYSFYYYYDLTDGLFPIVVETQKISGHDYHAYGVIFCYQSDSSMYRVWIDTDGWYRISSRDSLGDDAEIVGWTQDTTNINTGYGITNTIEISYIDPDYTLTINGANITSFDKAAGGYLDLTGGKSGFYASIGDATDEDFPNVPVDIRYKMTAPITVP